MTATTQTTQRVTIIGPNLRDQSKGTFHVHAAGCGDIARQAHRDPMFTLGWDLEATSLEHVAGVVYEDHIAEAEDMTAADYLSDFHFAPCVTLPVETPTQDDDEEEPECEGHPAGEFDPMGETVFCDGSCVARTPAVFAYFADGHHAAGTRAATVTDAAARILRAVPERYRTATANQVAALEVGASLDLAHNPLRSIRRER